MNRVLCQFKNENGDLIGTPIDLPLNIDKKSLESLFLQLYPQVI
jgi:hypothetical protein